MLKYSTIAFLLIQAVSAANRLVFTPNIVNMKHSGEPVEVKVSLAEPATSAVSVQFESSEWFRLDCCKIDFAPGQPAEKTFTIFPAGLLAKTTSTMLKTKLSTGEMQSIPVNREVMLPTAMCQSIGDPSYHTFDKTPITFQGTARSWYCLVEHPSFSVQTQMRQWSRGKNTNGNIAIRHYDGLLLLDISTGGKNVADKPYKVRKFGNQKVFASITCEKTFAEIELCEGGVIRIDYRFNKIWYADVTTKVPDFFCMKTMGMCGNFDNKTDTIDGAKVLMTDDKVYFKNQKTKDMIAPSKPIMQCKISASKSVQMEENKTIHCPSEQCVSQPTQYQGCDAYCKKLFSRFTCDSKMVNAKPYCDDCITNCKKSSNRSVRAAFASSAVKAFQEAAAFMAQACWKVNDTQGMLGLQKCARLETQTVVAKCNITDSAITGIEYKFPVMPKSCQNADGSLFGRRA